MKILCVSSAGVGKGSNKEDLCFCLKHVFLHRDGQLFLSAEASVDLGFTVPGTY